MRIEPFQQNYNINSSRKVQRNQSINFTGLKLPTVDTIKRTVKKYPLRFLLLSLFAVAGVRFGTALENVTEHTEQVAPLQTKFDTQESAINYAIARIVECMHETGDEYSVHINNKRHQIISEAHGNDTSVANVALLKHAWHYNTTPDYSFTMLHGHPPEDNGRTLYFSFQDIKSFMYREDCTTTYVVNKDGKYCKLEKTSDFKKLTEKEIRDLEAEYIENAYYSWPAHKTIYNKNGEVVFEIIDYPGMHNYLDSMAKRLGMIYSTTFGTYGIHNDIYKNGYHEAFYEKEEVIE